MHFCIFRYVNQYKIFPFRFPATHTHSHSIRICHHKLSLFFGLHKIHIYIAFSLFCMWECIQHFISWVKHINIVYSFCHTFFLLWMHLCWIAAWLCTVTVESGVCCVFCTHLVVWTVTLVCVELFSGATLKLPNAQSPNLKVSLELFYL